MTFAKILKIVASIVGAILMLLVLGLLYLLFVFDWNNTAGLIGTKASAAAGRQVAVDGIHVRWGWPVTHIEIEKLSIANTDGAKDPHMIALDKGEIDIDLRDLVTHFGRINLPSVVLTQPVIVLEKQANGDANWHFGSNPAASTVAAAAPDNRFDMPIIGQLAINGGKLTYRDAKKKTDMTLDISTASGTSATAKNIVLKGRGNLAGQTFVVDFTGGDILQLKNTSDPYPVDLDIEAGKTRFTAKGTVDDPISLQGFNIALTVKGENAADLFPVTGIALPPTPPYSVKGQLTLDTDNGKPAVWRFTHFAGKLGSSDLSGDLVFVVSGKRPVLGAKFVSKLLDFKDLGGFIGATPGDADKADASADQKQKKAEAEARATVIPDVPLDISRLAAMDAHVEFIGERINSPSLPLDDMFAKIDLDNSLLQIHPVRFGTANGDINATLNVNARSEPVKIDTDFKFHKLDLSRFFAGLAKTLGQPNVTKGNIGGEAKLAGTGKSLHEMLSNGNGTIGIGMEGGQISDLVVHLIGLDVGKSLGLYLGGDQPTPVRCIISSFAVNDGLATVDRFVIDTKASNIHGEGTLNFKNEALDMTLRPQPKSVSLLTLRSPINVRGTLKDPSVGVEGALGRAAVAGGLGVLLPFAAIAATVETGLGDDSDCKALLTEMKNDTQQQGKGLVPVNPNAAAAQAKKK